MEEFTLEKYLENPNIPIVDGEGHSVRILCTDLRDKQDRERYPILGLVERIDESGEPYDSPGIYTRQGEPGIYGSKRLYFSPPKKKCWVCLFRDENFPDIPNAEVTNSETQMLVYKALPGFIDCKEVEWEEDS